MFKSKSSKALKAAKQAPVYKQQYLVDCHRTYSCIHCGAHLANHDEIISKLFQGNHGRAYLFNKVANVGCKQAVQRELLTGLHAVADIYCDSCETTIGWKYEQAFVPSQKYKEGKYIIELAHILKENNWDLTSYNVKDLLEEAQPALNEDGYSFQYSSNRYKQHHDCVCKKAHWFKRFYPTKGPYCANNNNQENNHQAALATVDTNTVPKSNNDFQLIESNGNNSDNTSTTIRISTQNDAKSSENIELVERTSNRISLNTSSNDLNLRKDVSVSQEQNSESSLFDSSRSCSDIIPTDEIPANSMTGEDI